jgi:hypothetical protein
MDAAVKPLYYGLPMSYAGLTWWDVVAGGQVFVVFSPFVARPRIVTIDLAAYVQQALSPLRQKPPWRAVAG